MTHLARTALQHFVRYFPFSKGKHRVVSLLWKPLSFGAYDVQTTLRQANVKLRCDLTNFIQRQIFFSGSYEESYCEHWMRLSRKAEVIFDIGANVGIYSLLAATVNSRASIHAFEPTREMAHRLEENIKLNNLHNINVLPMGVGSKCGKAFLRICRGSDESNEGMNFLIAEGTPPQHDDLAVETVSLDDYCQQNNIDYIDILKVDIEGGEYDALLGAEKLLSFQLIGCLFIELSQWAATRSGHSTSEIIDLLKRCNYRMFRLGSNGPETLDLSCPPDGENIIAVGSQTAYNLLSSSYTSDREEVQLNSA